MMQADPSTDSPLDAEPRSVKIVLPASEVARAGLVVLGLVIGAYILWHIHEVIFLLFMGILLATAIEPMVNYLRRGRFGRGSGVLIVYSVIALTVGTLLAVTIPSLASQSDAFLSSIPEKIAALRPIAENLGPEPVETAAVRAIDEVSATVSNPTVPVDEQSLLQVITAIGHSLINFMTVFFLAFYWLVERATIKRALLRLVPASQARIVNTTWLEVEQKLGGWVRGQLFVMAIMGTLATIGFWVIGLPNPVLLGVLAALGELIPMIGPFLGFAPAVLVALGNDPWTALLVVGYAIVVQQIEGNFLVPRIMGHAVGVSPLTVVLGILIGAILYGLPGAFLAVPIAGAIQVIVAHALGMEEPQQPHVPIAAVEREAAAQAAAGAAATAPAGEEAEAAHEAAEEALNGTTPDPTRAARAAEAAVIAATSRPTT